MDIFKKWIFLFWVFVIFSMITLTRLSAQQSNFQIAPSPIAYPYFEEDRVDVYFGASYIDIAMDNINKKGGDLSGKIRSAISNHFAIDGAIGLTGLVGSMKPGIPPLSYDTFLYNSPVPDDKAELSFFAFRGSANIEFQPIHSSVFDIILFVGPQFTSSTLDITTEYTVVSNFTGDVYSGWEETLTVTSRMYGMQGGIQLDLKLGNDIMLSPFFMISTSSGSAKMKNLPDGGMGADSISYNMDIPSTTSMSYGMDIILGNISIGTVLQQLKSSGKENEDSTIIMISVGYGFPVGAENRKDEK